MTLLICMGKGQIPIGNPLKTDIDNPDLEENDSDEFDSFDDEYE